MSRRQHVTHWIASGVLVLGIAILGAVALANIALSIPTIGAP